MQKITLQLLGVALIGVTGCGTTTEIYDPENNALEIRETDTISSEEYRIVAVNAVQDLMRHPSFNAFLRRYKRQMKDPDAVPLLKVDQPINDTNDTQSMGEMVELLTDELLRSGKLNISRVEGTGRRKAIAQSRDLDLDDNFDQSTVQERNTLQAARLLLTPHVISNEINHNNQKVITRTFILELTDIKTGIVLWKFNKQLGFKETKPTFGW